MLQKQHPASFQRLRPLMLFGLQIQTESLQFAGQHAATKLVFPDINALEPFLTFYIDKCLTDVFLCSLDQLKVFTTSCLRENVRLKSFVFVGATTTMTCEEGKSLVITRMASTSD